MNPYVGLIFSLGKYQYKIQQITESEIVAIRLDSKGNETSKVKNFLLSHWPPVGATFSMDKDESKGSDKEPTHEDEKESVKDMPPHQDTDLGEAPDYPSVFFVYNHESQKLEVRDRRGNIKQEVPIMTINGTDGESAYALWLKDHKGSIIDFFKSLQGQSGKNGKNAYEEWKEWQGPGVDVSPEAYWAYFKGQNGTSAFELWKAVHGEKENSTPDDFFEYLKGQNGKDAYEVWQELGYKNGTRQDFFKWIASLVETQKGEDGKIFYPHFDGFTLYYTDDLEGKGTRLTEKDIRGKDGRTFKPIMDGTKLHFSDGEGAETSPVDLKGKDAFELWKEYHHKPNAKYEEFEEYFKGQNVQADHSYLDIKDFTCPVQTIDTELIANVLDSGKSPDKLIELRQQDIDKLREEGDTRDDATIGKYHVPYFFLNGSLHYKHWAGWFKEFSWWCAGADRPLLRMCPGDHSKYTGIGTVILFTALMAWFSSFIAMLLVFKSHLAAGAFATFWALMIFFLDRFITNTMYSDGEVSISKKEILGGLPRILIAIFLGIVISAPLELRIFESSIAQKVVVDRQDEAKKFYDKVLKEKREYLERSILALNSAIEEDSTKIKENDAKLEKLAADYKYPQQSEYQKKVPDYRYDEQGNKIQVGEHYVNDVKEFNRAVNTWKKNHPEYSKLQEENVNLTKRSYSNKESRVDSLSNIEAIAVAFAESKTGEFVCQQDTGLLRQLSTLHSLAMQHYEPWFYKKDAPDSGVKSLLMALDSLLHAWWWYLFNSAIGLIMLLFILIDISPVLYKMMLADGVYDKYLQQEKFLAQDKIRLSLARMLRSIEKGELKSLSPFVMGKIYRKLMKYSYSTDGKYMGVDKDYKNHINWEEDKEGLNEKIIGANKEVFDIVLDYKKRIILASYAAWYRDMRDAMIGAKDDMEGKKITPESYFKEDAQPIIPSSDVIPPVTEEATSNANEQDETITDDSAEA